MDKPEPTAQSGAPEGPTRLLAAADRRRILSGFRIKLVFTVFSGAVILGLSMLVFLLVDSIFDSLTPKLARNLEWKALRGAAELSIATQYATAVGDAAMIAEACRDYVHDDEVVAIVVTDESGQTLYKHGQLPIPEREVFSGAPAQVMHRPGFVWSWENQEIEGGKVGRVGLLVSTEALEAGLTLRKQILLTAGIGTFVALLLSLLFVSFYVGPLLELTRSSFLHLERATREALEATRVKSDFLANMSHEIRTPMHGILGMTALLLKGGLEPKLRRYAELVEVSAQALLAIINDILDFSKMEAGKYELRPIEFDLRLLAQDVVELMANRKEAERLELFYRIDPEVPQLLVADPDRLRQVLTNLVGNAIKFTHAGEVSLTITIARREGDKLVLRGEVRDTGVGISRQDLDKLFVSFSQIDASHTRKHGGTGLGLAITKTIVERMGGEIGVDSELGKGSTFWFTIPCQEPESPEQARGYLPMQGRILIVDDSAAYRAILEQQMKHWGMRYTIAGSVAAAKAILERAAQEAEPFDCAVVDVDLPSSDTDELVRAFRGAETPNAAVPLIMLTGKGPISEIPIPNVAATLRKPVRASDLYDCLMVVLSPKRVELKQRSPKQKEMPAPTMRGHILLVDDSAINQTVGVELLREMGFEVTTASNGLEAVNAVEKSRFDAVLMDCQMPEMDGYSATREIRSRETKGLRLPIIALTAHAMPGEREKIVEAGMDELLTKPVTARALRDTLRRFIPESESVPTAAPDNENANTQVPDVAAVASFLHVAAEVSQQLSRAAKGRDASAIRRDLNRLAEAAAAVGEIALSTCARKATAEAGDAEAALEEARSLLESVRERMEKVLLDTEGGATQIEAQSYVGQAREKLDRHEHDPATVALIDALHPRSLAVIGVFFEVVPRELEGIRIAFAVRDFAALRAAAHKLKGGSGSLGALRMAALCAALQHDAEACDESSASGRIAAIERAFELTKVFLEGERMALEEAV